MVWIEVTSVVAVVVDSRTDDVGDNVEVLLAVGVGWVLVCIGDVKDESPVVLGVDVVVRGTGGAAVVVATSCVVDEGPIVDRVDVTRATERVVVVVGTRNAVVEGLRLVSVDVVRGAVRVDEGLRVVTVDVVSVTVDVVSGRVRVEVVVGAINVVDEGLRVVTVEVVVTRVGRGVVERGVEVVDTLVVGVIVGGLGKVEVLIAVDVGMLGCTVKCASTAL